MKYYEISPPISSALAVFPGDQAFARAVSMDFGRGDHLLLSAITSTLHIGAHADSSSHYHAKGTGVDQRPLEPFLGRCQVIRPQAKDLRGKRLQVSDFSHVRIQAPRILVATGTHSDPTKWVDDFASFSPEVLNWLADQGVKLVGIDTPSVDPADSKALESHQVLFARDLCVLEGLILQQVPEGTYTLVALPLRIVDADASPVRAILLHDVLEL